MVRPSFPQVHCPLPNGLNLNSVLTMYPLQSDTIRFLLLLLVVALRTAIAIDYECFEKRIKVVSGPWIEHPSSMSRTIPFRPPQHPSECCANGFLFNRTQLNKCMKLYSMDEFREFEGLWENYCISECYFNETNINTAADGFANEKLAVKSLNSNPYLSPLDIATCVKEGRSSHIHHTSSVQG